MSYRINETDISVDIFNVNCTLFLDEKTELVVNVPVKYPKTKDEVIAAIELRYAAEKKKFDFAPVLEGIKVEVDAEIGKTLTVVAVK